MARKLSAIRQLSLQCETPPPSSASRRASLKKQHSEEFNEDSIGIRISLSAKNRNPKNIKVAWGEDDNAANGAAVDRKTKAATTKTTIRRHSHCSEQVKDNILYSRQDLALKLRQAWQQQEKTNKLNIFLAHNVTTTTSHLDQSQSGEETDNVTNTMEPKIHLPLMHPEMQANANLKNIFQKHLRKSSKTHSPRSPPSSSAGDAGSDDSETVNDKYKCHQTNAVVVVPIIERSTKSARTDGNNDENAEFEKNEKPRPSTAAAAQKRAIFQKRTNSAFQTICQPSNSTNRQFRPPMVRASSLPTNNNHSHTSNKASEVPKSKFLRKKVKSNSKRSKTNKHQQSDDNDDKKHSSDVVTMVSLVSPSESEPEETESIKEQNVPNNKSSPKKIAPNTNQHQWKKDENKHFSLRKTVKQVSFQQSSIHAVRSFSASFPARRASVATNLLLDNAVKKLQKSLEKRGQLDEGQFDAKRRLLRSTTISSGDDVLIHRESSSESSLSNVTAATAEHQQQDLMTTNDNDDVDDCKRKVIAVEAKSIHDVESAKEKKCWETYCRMTKSGLTMSFDTILRGMLTPTEYRLRRKLAVECEEGHDDAITTAVSEADLQGEH